MNATSPLQGYTKAIASLCSLGLGMELVWSGYGGGTVQVICVPEVC